MREYIKKSKLIVAGAQLLVERGIRKELALSTATRLAENVPSRQEFAGEPMVDAAVEATFLGDLLRLYMPDRERQPGDDRDVDLSWGKDGPGPIEQLDALLGELQTQDQEARSHGSILATAPAVTGDPSFSSSNSAFAAAIGRPTTSPPSFATTGGGTVLPIVPAAPTTVPVTSLVAKGPTGQPVLPPILRTPLAKRAIQDAADRDFAEIVRRTRASLPVAKTSGAARTVRVIKAS